MFTPVTLEGYKLLHHGMLALSDVMTNGMAIDEEYVRDSSAHLKRQIKRQERILYEHPEVKRWRRKYGKNFNLESDEQLADILFNEFGHEAKVMTEKGNPSVSAAALEQVDAPVVSDLMQLRKWQKADGTFLKNILRETVNGFLNPFFNLHTVSSYRSSSSAINFQNIPVRDKTIKKLIRQAFKPRPGRLIVEVDYSGVEVRVATCYHKDPNMIAEITDSSRDMHRDMAMECYVLGPDEWTKDTRYCGKNKFVFPQFYGDWYKACARNLYDAIHLMKLQTKQGTPLLTHLKNKGLGTYEKFEDHIKSVESRFWTERFGVYGAWRDDWWEAYQDQGYFDTLTGFRCQGIMTRNECTNLGVQGSAFHCLLRSLIVMNAWLKENNMQTKIVGQIHDSMVLDVHPAEYNRVLHKLRKVMTDELVKAWPWIIVPLDIEIEVTPVDGSWYLKKEVQPHLCRCGCRHCYKSEIKNDDKKTGVRWTCPICGESTDERIQ